MGIENPERQRMASTEITGRRLTTYEEMLGFNRSLFEGQNVLNFGCGKSNISGAVQRAGIQANVVDLDLVYDPMKGPLAAFINMLDNSFVDSNSSLHKKLVQIKRRIGLVADRTIIQANGIQLPFADQTFDTTLALFSTYQVPQADTSQVYRELLRVSNAVHCAPVGEEDNEILQMLAKKQGFEIIYSCDYAKYPREAPVITNTNDYNTYRDNSPHAARIQPPPQKSPGIPGTPQIGVVVGNLVILKRRK